MKNTWIFCVFPSVPHLVVNYAKIVDDRGRNLICGRTLPSRLVYIFHFRPLRIEFILVIDRLYFLNFVSICVFLLDTSFKSYALIQHERFFCGLYAQYNIPKTVYFGKKKRFAWADLV